MLHFSFWIEERAIGETYTSDRSDRNGGTVPRPLITVDNK
jgi:hypothetical protein